MWRLTAAVVGVLVLAGCASSAGADRDAHGSAPTTSSPGTAAQAVAAALAFAAHSDLEVGVVDGYASVPSAVQRGEHPLTLPAGRPILADGRRPTGSRHLSAPLSKPPSVAAPSPSFTTPPPRLASVRPGPCWWSLPDRCWPAGAAR
jgi:hypothetical protein